MTALRQHRKWSARSARCTYIRLLPKGEPATFKHFRIRKARGLSGDRLDSRTQAEHFSPFDPTLMVGNLGVLQSHDAGETPKFADTFGGFTY